jgi:ABC-2 type transport system ATP-binding protein
VRALIKRMGESKAIIFSTHILEEVEAACSRAIIIDRGKVVADGTPDELKQRGLQAVRIAVKDVAGPAVREQIEKIGGIHQIDSANSKENSFSARLLVAKGRKPADIAREVSALAATHRWTLEELHQEEGRLDEVFRSITRSDTTA